VKKRDGIFPGNGAPVSYEGLLPELALLITSRLDELLVILIGDLMPVDKKVVNLSRRCVCERVRKADLPTWDNNHLGWNALLGTKIKCHIEGAI